ncbi:hypothetical protein HY844_01565 [Candidatus Berkelbacteria bacterium]|nr:hypothetical protein [Candidatus Berkelbacteria bacterium]
MGPKDPRYKDEEQVGLETDTLKLPDTLSGIINPDRELKEGEIDDEPGK